MGLEYGHLLQKAWDSIKHNLALSAGLSFVYFLAATFLSFLPIIGPFIAALLAPGYILSLVKIRDTNSVNYNDFFWCFQDFNRVLHYGIMFILKAVIIAVGFIFLIIPGIYLLVSFMLASTHFVFRKQDGIDAITSSMKLVKNHWWFMFGLGIIIIFLNIAGALSFLLGLLITIPVSVLTLLYALEELEKISKTTTTS